MHPDLLDDVVESVGYQYVEPDTLDCYDGLHQLNYAIARAITGEGMWASSSVPGCGSADKRSDADERGFYEDHTFDIWV